MVKPLNTIHRNSLANHYINKFSVDNLSNASYMCACLKSLNTVIVTHVKHTVKETNYYKVNIFVRRPEPV